MKIDMKKYERNTVDYEERFFYCVTMNVFLNVKSPWCISDINSMGAKEIIENMVFDMLKAGAVGHNVEMLPSNKYLTVKID